MIKLKARLVLEDCRKAHSLLEEATDPQTFRILFVSAITLCRAVGHVLDKVDSKEGPTLKDAIGLCWEDVQKNKEEHLIFHGFINKQRNLVLKEYQFSHDDSDQKIVVLPQMEEFLLGERLFCPITEGDYAGQDCRDILSDAIGWWESRLTKVEKSAFF